MEKVIKLVKCISKYTNKTIEISFENIEKKSKYFLSAGNSVEKCVKYFTSHGNCRIA